MSVTLTRRTALTALGGSLLATVAGRAVAQANYPSRVIRLVVPYAAGGGGDALARIMGPKLADTLGQSVIVDNKPGASGVIGVEAVTHAPADGYTMLLHTLPMVMVPAMLTKPPYDPVTDLVPIAEIIYTPLWLVVSTARTKATTVKELVEQVRAEPRKHNFASIAPGSTGHLMGYEFNAQSKLDMEHVGYKGGAPATQALLTGEVTAAFLDFSTLKPHLAGGKIRLLAVSGSERSRNTPDVPTLKELGYVGFETTSWGGLFFASGTPAPIVQKMSDTVMRLLKDPEIVSKYQGLGYEIPSITREQFAQQIKADRDHWANVIRRADIKMN